MPFFTKNEKTFFFSHIPKTGGESIRDFFIRNNYNISFYSDSMAPSSLQHRDNRDKELIKEIQKYNIICQFTIIRDPLDRLVSEFFMRQDSYVKTSGDFKKFVEDVFERYKKNSFINDNHIKPQINFIHKNMDIFLFGNWVEIENYIKKYDTTICGGIKKTNFSDPIKPYNGALDYATRELKWVIDGNLINNINNFYKEDFDLIKKIKI